MQNYEIKDRMSRGVHLSWIRSDGRPAIRLDTVLEERMRGTFFILYSRNWGVE